MNNIQIWKQEKNIKTLKLVNFFTLTIFCENDRTPFVRCYIFIFMLTYFSCIYCTIVIIYACIVLKLPFVGLFERKAFEISLGPTPRTGVRLELDFCFFSRWCGMGFRNFLRFFIQNYFKLSRGDYFVEFFKHAENLGHNMADQYSPQTVDETF